MKINKFILFLLTILSSVGIFAQTTQECDFFIRSSFDSECILTNYPEKERPNYDLDNNECLTACMGSTINYYIQNQSSGYTNEWSVSGTSDYSANASGTTLTVHWPDALNSGTVYLTATASDGTVCLKEVCINLIEKPIAGIESNPMQTEVDAYGVKHIYVCDDQVIDFYSNSSSSSEAPIVAYFWEDGLNTYATENISITADYEIYGDGIKVHHQVFNECGCYDDAYYIIHISKYPILSVDCYGTACENNQVTYTTAEDCGAYVWSIEGGDIIAGQNTSSITVNWSDPDNGYGYIALDGDHCEENNCPYLTYLPVPIIEDEVSISGPDIVCEGDIVYYELPIWASTNYNWSITPTTGVDILQSGYRNKYMIEFTQLGTYTINANYNNDFLDCSGQALPKEVIVKEAVSINANNNACVGEPVLFETSIASTGTVVWTVFDGDMNVVYSTTGNSLNYTFTTDGSYTISASNSEFCTDAQKSITIYPLPPTLTPDVTEWETKVCINSGYLFNAVAQDDQYFLHWEASCGTPNEMDGEEYNVTIGAPVCDILLTQVDRITGCQSLPYVHHLEEFVPDPINWTTPEVCANEDFNISIPNQDDVLYNWSVNPSSAASIIAGTYSNNLTLQANAASGYFNLILKRSYCEQILTENYPVHISDYLIPEMNLSDVCQNSTLTITPTNTSNVSGTWTWLIEGHTYTATGTASSVSCTYTFLNSGSIPVSLTFRANGCTQGYQIIETIEVVPAPNANINAEVNGTNIDLILVSQGSNTYLWSNGATTYTTSVPAPSSPTSYHCTVTNVAGCSSVENITIQPADLPPCSEQEGDITAVIDCNIGNFTRTGFNTSYPISWKIDGALPIPSTTISGANNQYCEANFTVPGNYIVKAKQYYDACFHVAVEEIAIPLIPAIEYTYTCNGADQIDLELADNSSYLLGTTITNIAWQIDGNPSTSNPTVSSGTHTITIDVTYTYQGSTYTCSTDLPIELIRAVADFNISPAPYCDGTPMQFTDASTGVNISSWLWTFGGISQQNYNQNVEQTIANATGDELPVVITLQIQDHLGCVSTKTMQISLNPNLLGGLLDPEDAPICAGSAWNIVYAFTSTPSSTVSYQWMPTNQTTSVNNNDFYQTGFYYALLSDDKACSFQSPYANIRFDNTPDAVIMGNDMYCEYEDIELLGYTGSSYTYFWSVLGGTNYTSPNISIPAGTLSNGLRLVNLQVSNGTCTANTIREFVINPSPAAPSIGFGANQCLHEPPVNLISNSGTPLYWNNGQYNSHTNTYSSGFHTAYYLDPNTGCRSNFAFKYVSKPPEFDELMSGCFEFCKADLPLSLLGPSGNFSAWKWKLDYTTIIQAGNNSVGNLDIPDFGIYNLSVEYSPSCGTTSDDLYQLCNEYSVIIIDV